MQVQVKVQSAMAVNDDSELGALSSHVRTYLSKYLNRYGAELPATGLHQLVSIEVERALISLVLERTGGNQTQAAGVLGINRNTLRKKIKELDLQV